MTSLKRYITSITEMASPTTKDKRKKYYHGTSLETSGQSIIKSGINPPDLTLEKPNKLTPRLGKVYITPSIEYAQMYAIGANMAGHDVTDMSEYKENPFGYVFVIDGKQLKDIEPDEDCVGEMFYYYNRFKQFNKNYDHKQYDITGRNYDTYMNLDWLIDLGRRHCTPYQFKKAIAYDDYADLAVFGKKVIPYMSDAQKLEMIHRGAHIAHTGAIKPSEVWKLDKKDVPKLKENGSNFFKVAKRIK